MAFPSLMRLTLSIALTLSSFVFSVICFTPPPRFGQASVLINNQIYYMGGIVPPPEPTISDFFYLDTSALTSTTDPSTLPWTELTGDNLFTSWGTAVAGGANNDLFVLFGGRMTPADNAVIVYSTSNNTWFSPTNPQNDPTRRRQTQAVVDSTGKMYIFGGSTSLGLENPSPVNNMDILDTVNWSWSTGTSDASPDARFDFSATILSNGVIVYIGGTDTNGLNVQMDQIYMYNTSSDTWTSTVATGDIPGSRGGHSAVLTSDGRIIIYGGATTGGQYAAASPDIAVLDTTNNNNFVWSQPNASGTVPPQIAYHSASLVGNYMFVSFGNITNGGSSSSNVYVLDTSNNNYNWVTSINTNASAGTNSGNQSPNVGLIVGATIAGIVVLILLGGGLFWLYRRREMSGVIETPGEFTDAGFNRRYETMNSATTSQTSHDLSKYLTPSNTEPDPSREFHPSYSHNFPVQHDPQIEEDDGEFRVLPKELQPEYLEKYRNNNI